MSMPPAAEVSRDTVLLMPKAGPQSEGTGSMQPRPTYLSVAVNCDSDLRPVLSKLSSLGDDLPRRGNRGPSAARQLSKVVSGAAQAGYQRRANGPHRSHGICMPANG